MKCRPPWDGIRNTVRPRSWPAPPAGEPGRGEGRAGFAAPCISATPAGAPGTPGALALAAATGGDAAPGTPGALAPSSARRAPGCRDCLRCSSLGAPAACFSPRWAMQMDGEANGGGRSMSQRTVVAGPTVASVAPPASGRRSTPRARPPRQEMDLTICRGTGTHATIGGVRTAQFDTILNEPPNLILF